MVCVSISAIDNSTKGTHRYRHDRHNTHFLTLHNRSKRYHHFPVYDKKGIQIGTKKAPIDANLKQFILLVNKGGFSIEDSLKLVTSNPARNLGLKNKGTLSIGNDADFCLVDSKLNLMDVFANGQQFLKEGKIIKSNYDVT